jgi:DNA modification methylase
MREKGSIRFSSAATTTRCRLQVLAGLGQGKRRQRFADCELAWTNLPQAVRRIKWRWAGMLQQDMANKEEREHPTQKPVPVMRWALMQAKGVQTVCDPFMGSGTTGVACVMEGLQFVGIERERKYFDIACRRIEQAYAQPRLFEDAKVGAGDTAIQEDWTK